MSYLVLARKYRPQNFADVIGQQHVTTTLSNAIQADRVAHAILFSGPRGTGKTTIARILAKAINCKEGPTPDPCNTCRSCKEITQGHASDVFEIDGASNNSVDQIRELRDNIQYMPAHSPRKIYIIDEVHMLSVAAFNALLKTLEEPPSHVMFLFATTEPHKIPVTILSRCQRHDLHRVPLDWVVAHLSSLCQKEDIPIPDHVLTGISRESEGSMRDALSLLDQAMSCVHGGIDDTAILDMLGVVDQKSLFDLGNAVSNRDLQLGLATVANLYQRGHDLTRIFNELTAHIRNLYLAKLGPEYHDLIDLPETDHNQLKNHQNTVSEDYLSQALSALLSYEGDMRYAQNPRIAFETILVRLCRMHDAMAIDVLIDKLDEIQKGVDWSAPEQQPVAQMLPPSPPAPVIQEKASDVNVPPVCQPVTPDTDVPEPPVAPTPGTPDVPEVPAETPEVSSPDVVSQKTVQPETPPVHEPVITGSSDLPDEAPAIHEADTASAPTEAAYRSGMSNDDIWRKIYGQIQKSHKSLSSILNKAEIISVSEKIFEIRVSGNKYNLNRIQSDKSMGVLNDVATGFFGRSMRVKIDAVQEAAPNMSQQAGRASQLRQEALNSDVVNTALEILGGTVHDVIILEEEPDERHG